MSYQGNTVAVIKVCPFQKSFKLACIVFLRFNVILFAPVTLYFICQRVLKIDCKNVYLLYYLAGWANTESATRVLE